MCCRQCRLTRFKNSPPLLLKNPASAWLSCLALQTYSSRAHRLANKRNGSFSQRLTPLLRPENECLDLPQKKRIIRKNSRFQKISRLTVCPLTALSHFGIQLGRALSARLSA